MSRRPHLRTAGLAATAALSALTLVACGSSTPTTPNIAQFKQTAGSAAACGPIMASLPKTLNQQPRVKSTGSRFGAAWGDPAITLRCGVPEPKTFDPYASCLTVNGVDWFLTGDVPDDASSDQDITVTTVYRHPAIEITIPAKYGTQGPSTAMALLTSVVRNNTVVSQRCL